MAVYDGVPSIRLEGDRNRALALIPEAKALLYQVQEFLRIAEVSTHSSSRSVGEDGYIYVLCSHGLNIIHIAVDVQAVDQVEEEIPRIPDGLATPSFYSGLVFGGFLEPRTSQGRTYQVCSTFAPTPVCLTLHDELLPGRQPVGRLAVEPYYDELRNQSGAGPAYSQYTALRPSMYSGLMATVVQLVMGYGRMSKYAFRDQQNPGPLSEYAKRVERNGVQILFDYKYYRTHGIVTGADGTLWLVQISQSRGVIAVPLPIFPRSQTAGYRNAAEARGDTPMVTAIDELGCLPTGEAFPLHVEERIAAGDVLQLATADAINAFYQHLPYSINCGWAFNLSGSEAHNTGYRYGDDDIQRGVWYQLSIQIGALNPAREPGQPIATGSASLRRQSEGTLYGKGLLARYLPIKFYDPLLGGLRSHDGTPAQNTNTPAPRCDTVMYVHFVGDVLKVVKFYRNPQEDNIDETDDPRYPGECMVAGEWVITKTDGIRGFPTMMYSNELDDRHTLEPTIKTTTIVSTDLGFDPPRFFDDIASPESGVTKRWKVFRRTTTIDTREGQSLRSSVVVPQFCRELHYHAVAEYERSSGSIQVLFDYLQDPNVGYHWRNFPRLAAPSWPTGIGCRLDRCGGVQTNDGHGPHKERKIVCMRAEPYECSDFADSGTWLTLCQTVDSFRSVVPRFPTYESWVDREISSASLRIVGRGFNGPHVLPLTLATYNNSWNVPSPSPITNNIQQMAATYSALGQDCAIFEDSLTSPVVRYNGYIPTSLDSAIPCFIGANHP